MGIRRNAMVPFEGKTELTFDSGPFRLRRPSKGNGVVYSVVRRKLYKENRGEFYLAFIRYREDGTCAIQIEDKRLSRENGISRENLFDFIEKAIGLIKIAHE